MSESNPNKINDSELGESLIGRVLPRTRASSENVRLRFKKGPSGISLFTNRAVKDRRVNNVYCDNVSLATVTFDGLVSLEDAKKILIELGYNGETEVV